MLRNDNIFENTHQPPLSADRKVTGTGGAYNTLFREMDARTGRWWTTDPVVKEWESREVCEDLKYLIILGAGSHSFPKRNLGKRK